jgi:outer membrane biosynthesis protein TonB
MEQERNYTQQDLDAAYSQGWRAGAPRAKASGSVATVFAVIAIIIMVGIMALTYLGISPARLTTSAPAAPTPASAPQVPRVQPAPVVQPQAPIVVQSVPQGAAPQPVVIPQPAPVAQPANAPAAEPAPKPVVIVLHDGYQQPVVTGPGACQVAKGARRCGK